MNLRRRVFWLAGSLVLTASIVFWFKRGTSLSLERNHGTMGRVFVTATRQSPAGLKIAGWSAVLNSVLYWIHERVWNWLQWNRKPKDSVFFLDGHPRTTTKMVTWRIVVNFSNFFIPYFITGSWGQAGAFFTIAVFVNMALFYGHERIWNRIRWGKRAAE